MSPDQKPNLHFEIEIGVMPKAAAKP